MDEESRKVAKMQLIRRTLWVMILFIGPMAPQWAVWIPITLLVIQSELQSGYNSRIADWNKEVHNWAGEVNDTMTKIADMLEKAEVEK